MPWPVCAVLYCATLCAGTGKGPVGIYAIDSRYALIAESLYDTLFVIDVQWGGPVARKEVKYGVVTGMGVELVKETYTTRHLRAAASFRIRTGLFVFRLRAVSHPARCCCCHAC